MKPGKNDLTAYYLEGVASDSGDAPQSRCPHYATSDAADAWYTGAAIGRGLIPGFVATKATKGRGARVNLFAADGSGVAVAVSYDSGFVLTDPVDRWDAAPVQLAAAAPLRSKGHAVEDAGHLPLFVAANEPALI